MEVFWASVEGQLVAMLEGLEEPLTLKLLNDATLAWLEHHYHRRTHRELGVSPHARFLDSNDVSRPCPDLAILKAAFRIRVTRTQRRSDGTFSLDGVRFQVPRPWRHQTPLRVRYARWDRNVAELVDEDDQHLCTVHPLDKHAHADGVRRPLASRDEDTGPPGKAPPALLRKLLRKQASNGLASPWLPFRKPNDEEDPPS